MKRGRGKPFPFFQIQKSCHPFTASLEQACSRGQLLQVFCTVRPVILSSHGYGLDNMAERQGLLLKIIRKIPVKQVITERSKESLAEQFNQNKQQLEQECQQLQFEQRKLQNKKGVSKHEVAKRFQQEIKRRKDKIKWIEFQLEQLGILPIGSEITEEEVETLVEVEEGLNWGDISDNKAIIVKDGIVIQIT